MNERKALQGLEIDKQNFESFFTIYAHSLAPDVWERVCKEIDGRVENFVIELMANLAEEIEENGYEYE